MGFRHCLLIRDFARRLSFMGDCHLVGCRICTVATAVKRSFTSFAVIIVPVIVMAMVVNNDIQRFYYYCDASPFPDSCFHSMIMGFCNGFHSNAHLIVFLFESSIQLNVPPTELVQNSDTSNYIEYKYK